MKKSILLVDDFENTLFVTAFTLERFGYNIFKAESGKKALEILKSNKDIDLIITDYNMPEMNGLQFVEKVKTLTQNRSLPIFILSTEAKEEIKKAANNAGVTLWIKKPFKSDQLLEYIKKTIG